MSLDLNSAIRRLIWPDANWTEFARDVQAALTKTAAYINNIVADLEEQIAAAGGGGITELTGDVTAGPGSGAQVATLTAAATGTGDIVRETSPTIVTPTIADFTNAQHDHSDAANGGPISASAIVSWSGEYFDADAPPETPGADDDEFPYDNQTCVFSLSSSVGTLYLADGTTDTGWKVVDPGARITRIEIRNRHVVMVFDGGAGGTSVAFLAKALTGSEGTIIAKLAIGGITGNSMQAGIGIAAADLLSAPTTADFCGIIQATIGAWDEGVYARRYPAYNAGPTTDYAVGALRTPYLGYRWNVGGVSGTCAADVSLDGFLFQQGASVATGVTPTYLILFAQQIAAPKCEASFQFVRTGTDADANAFSIGRVVSFFAES